MESSVLKITRKNWPVFVLPMKVKDLDSAKCSHKFSSLNLDEDSIVYVKCFETGEIDSRGKKEEYRILPPKEMQ
jgi:hypothetical protein